MPFLILAFPSMLSKVSIPCIAAPRKPQKGIEEQGRPSYVPPHTNITAMVPCHRSGYLLNSPFCKRNLCGHRDPKQGEALTKTSSFMHKGTKTTGSFHQPKKKKTQRSPEKLRECNALIDPFTALACCWRNPRNLVALVGSSAKTE